MLRSNLGLGLKAKNDLQPGDIALKETPFLIAPISLEGFYARFLALTDEELKFLGSLSANIYALSKSDEKAIAARSTQATHQGLRWFVAVMKSNGHGLAHGEPLWAIYEKAVRANHSCDPNVSYRNENGMLVYVAMKPIKAGEEIFVTYTDTLFASHQFRTSRLFRQKLFLCECVRCSKEVDPLRRVWCPHCRTKDQDKSPAFATFVGPASGLRNLPQFQMTQRMNADKCADSDDWWMCTSCGMTYNSAVLPVAVETTLESIFETLDSQFALPDSNVWMQYLTYLYQTTLMVLGPMHWLVGASHYLFSRYYAGVWNGGQKELKYKDLAIDHGMKFIDFVKAVSPEAIISDVVPWASVLLRLCLDSGDVENFTNLASQYLINLRALYGINDGTVMAYEDAIKWLHETATKGECIIQLADLQKFAKRSVRRSPSTKKMKRQISRKERIWLKPHKLQYDFSVLESNALKRQRKPWLNVQEPPQAFLKMAQKHLANKPTHQ